jgi:hypothetical protein
MNSGILIQLFEYCNNYNNIPKYHVKHNGYNVGDWYNINKKKIKSIDDELYKQLSINEIIKCDLDEYLKLYFL